MEWIAIAAIGALTGFLLLAVLGAMREVVILRGDVHVFRELIQHPPAPSFVRDRIPDSLLGELVVGKPGASDRQVVAFLAPGCKPCEDLGEGLVAAVAAKQVSGEDICIDIWAFTVEEAEQFAARLPLRCVIDAKGSLSRAWEVRSTPTVFLVSRSEKMVLDYTLEGARNGYSVEWRRWSRHRPLRDRGCDGRGHGVRRRRRRDGALGNLVTVP